MPKAQKDSGNQETADEGGRPGGLWTGCHHIWTSGLYEVAPQITAAAAQVCDGAAETV